MTPKQFRALLDLMMCCDPWPVDDPSNQETVEFFVNATARLYGYDSWYVAFHEFKPL